MVTCKVNKTAPLSDEEVQKVSREALSGISPEDKRILTIIPDSTRTAPLPIFFRLLDDFLGQKAKSLDFLIALGTHPPLGQEDINRLWGRNSQERGKHQVFNHRWDDPSQLQEIGKIRTEEVEKISGGLFREEVRITVNKLIFAYDYLIIISPTFPHEVVGFSGGNKYFFRASPGRRSSIFSIG